MALLCRLEVAPAGRSITPFIAGFAATLVSGALFAGLGTVLMGAALVTVTAKSPLCWARPYSMLSWCKRCTPR